MLWSLQALPKRIQSNILFLKNNLVTTFLAEREVIINRVAKCLLQLVNTSSLKSDNVFQIEPLAMKEAGFIVEVDAARL